MNDVKKLDVWDVYKRGLKNTAKKYNRPFFIESWDRFLINLAYHCQQVINSRNENDTFYYHEHLRPIVSQLYLHFIGDHRFKGDLNAGIVLHGAKGVGKTTLLEGYVKYIDASWNRNFTYWNARRLSLLVEREGEHVLTNIQRKPLMLDEIGQEVKEVLHMGTRIKPIPELINLKYEVGSWLFGTSNYSFEKWGEMYGTTISTRIGKMSNRIEVENINLRRDNLIKL